MHEAISLVKVRKATKVTIPAGGWMLLLQPDKPLHEHISARAKLVKNGNVNEDYERLLVGRLQDSNSPITFVTEAQAEEAKQEAEERKRLFEQSNQQAKEIQKKREEDEQKAREEARKKEVEAANKSTAAIHKSLGFTPTAEAVKPDVETESADETKPDSGTQTT